MLMVDDGLKMMVKWFSGIIGTQQDPKHDFCLAEVDHVWIFGDLRLGVPFVKPRFHSVILMNYYVCDCNRICFTLLPCEAIRISWYLLIIIVLCGLAFIAWAKTCVALRGITALLQETVPWRAFAIMFDP